MQTGSLLAALPALAASLLCSAVACADVTGIVTEASNADDINGAPLRVTRVYALVSTPTDRVFTVSASFLGGSATFHHHDLMSDGEYSTTVGTWSPALTMAGGVLDSFVSVGNAVNSSNPTVAAAGWGPDGLNRADFPMKVGINAYCAWTTLNPSSGGPNALGRVLVAQFVTNRDDVALWDFEVQLVSPGAPKGGTVLIAPDLCPNSIKNAPGQCGCDQPETDSDLDGTNDCADAATTMVAMPAPIAANKVNPVYFGASMSAAGDWIAVGAPLSMYLADYARGAVLLFKRDGNGWKQEQAIAAPLEFPADFAGRDGFGTAVKFVGDALFVGAPTRRVASGSTITRGTVYVFRFDAKLKKWRMQETILSPRQNNAQRSSFGTRIDAAAGRVIVSDPADRSEYPRTGSVSILETDNDGLWTERAHVTNPIADGENDRGFGMSIAAWGNDLAVGAAGTLAGNPGSVYLYRRDARGNWSALQTLLHPTGNTTTSGFGTSIAMSARTLAVAAGSLSVPNSLGLPLPPLETSGVELYERGADGLWADVGRIVPTEWTAQLLGRRYYFADVVLDGDRLAFGVADGAESYVYRRIGGSTWIPHATLKSTPTPYTVRPSSIAFVGPMLVSAYSPRNARTDGSFVAENLALADCDGDGVADPDRDGDGLPDCIDPDKDGDGVDD